MPDDADPDWYETLQVSPSAEREVIEAAYKRLAQKYHPDRDPSSGALERMKLINCAYDVLREPVSRARYDAQRATAAKAERRRRAVGRAEGSLDQESEYREAPPQAPAVPAAAELQRKRGSVWEFFARAVGLAVGMVAIKVCVSHEREQGESPVGAGYEVQQPAATHSAAFSTSTESAGWVWYSPPNGSFRVLLPRDPGAPRADEVFLPRVGRMTKFSVEAKRTSGVLYGVQWSDYPAGSLVNAELTLTGARDGAVAAIHGSLVTDRALVLGGYPAREYTTTASRFVLRTRMCLLQSTRLVVVTAVVPAGTNEDADVTAFLESFNPIPLQLTTGAAPTVAARKAGSQPAVSSAVVPRVRHAPKARPRTSPRC